MDFNPGSGSKALLLSKGEQIMSLHDRQTGRLHPAVARNLAPGDDQPASQLRMSSWFSAMRLPCSSRDSSSESGLWLLQLHHLCREVAAREGCDWLSLPLPSLCLSHALPQGMCSFFLLKKSDRTASETRSNQS